jgi:hypothetical protein
VLRELTIKKHMPDIEEERLVFEKVTVGVIVGSKATGK